MKDNRFIELVNLYIDRQITAREAADLEAEMQANPRRRAIYREYCKMHRATTMVYESFRTDATEAVSAAGGPSRASIAPFEIPASKKRLTWSYYAGGLAAACIALVLVNRNSSVQIDNNNLLAAFNPKAKITAPAVLAAVPVAPATQSVAVASNAAPSLMVEKDYSAVLASLRQDDQRSFASGEIQSSRLPSLFEDGVFDSRSEVPGANQRVFRAKLPASAQTSEFTAFQFQR